MLKVVDSVMGSGKTSYIIQLLKKSIQAYKVAFDTDVDSVPKYLVITPYLDQIDYIKEQVPEAIAPISTAKNKSENLIGLLQNKTDIILCTHNLLHRFSEFDLLKPYTILIDEAIDVIEVMYDDGEQDDSKTISVEDIQILIKSGMARETEDRFIEWIGDEYKGLVYSNKDNNIYKYLLNKSLAIREDKVYKLLSPRLFDICQDIYVFTYMFDAQNMYYYCRYFDIPFEYWHIIKDGDKYDVQKGKAEDSNHTYPIHIYDGELNNIGKNGLTKNWFVKNASETEIDQLQRNIYNYLRNICPKFGVKANVGNIIWTTFKKYAGGIAKGNDKCTLDRKTKAGKEKKGNFVSCTARATNNYRHANVVAYAVNRYQKPEITRFFQEKEGIVYDEDKFALQEMLQFIWRSAIREGNPINGYIPSKRMRDMLNNWLNPVKP